MNTKPPAFRPVELSSIFKESPYAHHQPEVLAHEGKRAVRVRCLKCGAPIVIVAGDKTREEIEEILLGLTNMPWECPGYHVELSGRELYWRFSDVMAALFPPAPAVVFEQEPEAPPSKAA